MLSSPVVNWIYARTQPGANGWVSNQAHLIISLKYMFVIVGVLSVRAVCPLCALEKKGMH